MKETNQLQELIDSDPILSINEKSLSSFARLSNFWQILDLLEWKKAEGIEDKNINYEKVFDEEFLKTAKIIVDKIESVLWSEVYDLRGANIWWITRKAWARLIETWELENFVVWNYIKKIAFKVSNINLRYERYKTYVENRKLKIKNKMDPLTGLLTKHSINNYIEKALNSVNEEWENYWVVLIDIDNFKLLNDNFWHIAWDIVLEEISLIFKQHFREIDKVARWWWEEFLILMKWGNLEKYWEKLNKVKNIVKKELLKNVNRRIKEDWKNLETINLKNITISVWVTDIETCDTVASVTHRADEAMYSSKSWWRDRVSLLTNVKEIKKI